MSESQAPPYVVTFEPTEGCNLRCHFCGVASIRGPGDRGDRSGPYRFMPVDTARRVAQQMREYGWNSRIEFAMHGEPSLNVELPAIVAAIREHLPTANLMLITNGIPLMERGWVDTVTALYDAGLSAIALDDYPPHRVSVEARAHPIRGVEMYEYPADPRGNPHRRRARNARPLLSIMESIDKASEGNHKTINNGTGCAGPPIPEPLAKRCTRPFREFQVRWDGNIALCCNDWRGEYKIGNVLESDVEELWQSAPFRSARRLLYAADRDFGVCRGCDYFGGFRPGLLPDQTGQATLPAPDDDDRAIAEHAMVGASFTAPVERKWETEIVMSRKPGA